MPEQPVVCRLDLAPARLTVTDPGAPSRVRDRARVIITADHAYVFVDSAEGPILYLDGRLDDFEGRNTIGWRATLGDGTILDFNRSGGCNCGSQLRSFRPFPQGLVQGPFNTE